MLFLAWLVFFVNAFMFLAFIFKWFGLLLVRVYRRVRYRIKKWRFMRKMVAEKA